jgi:hypothetical protein
MKRVVEGSGSPSREGNSKIHRVSVDLLISESSNFRAS